MERTVVALFDNLDTAQAAVQQLIASGFSRNDISVVRTNQQDDGTLDDAVEGSEKDVSSAATGAGIGAVLGGLAGLLVGLGALAIPGIGPIIAAGPIATTLAGAGIGAATGGLVGALANAGIPQSEADAYVEGVRRGGTLVTVRVGEDQAANATEILNRFSPVDINQRAGEWQASGWTGYDTEAGPYSTSAGAPHTQQAADMAEDKPSSTDWGQSPDYRSETGFTGENISGNPEGTGSAGYTGTDTITSGPATGESDRGGSGRFEDYDPDFRNHWENNYRGSAGIEYGYERYQPAYKYGWQLGEQYQGRKWRDFEAASRTGWERSHPDDAWQDFRAAIYYGWQLFGERGPDTGQNESLNSQQGSQYDDPGPDQGYDRTVGEMSRGFNTYDQDFRSDWQRSFGSSGYGYQRYRPAYQYGYNLATDAKYRSQEWSDIEAEARRDWEMRHPNDAWDDFRDAIRHAWDRVRTGTDDTLD